MCLGRSFKRVRLFDYDTHDPFPFSLPLKYRILATRLYLSQVAKFWTNASTLLQRREMPDHHLHEILSFQNGYTLFLLTYR